MKTKLYDAGKYIYSENKGKKQKFANIEESENKIFPNTKEYIFISNTDECNMIYAGYSLEEAIEQYLKDTKYQKFAYLQLFTNNKYIYEESEKILPF